jgi:hypothetical protein
MKQGSIHMAQLIKLQDYISRYQMGVYRYPSQFIRLKQERWREMKRNWEEEQQSPQQSVRNESQKQEIRAHSLKQLFKRKKEEPNKLEFEMYSENVRSPYFNMSLEHLKIAFLDDLLQLQLQWASSTLREKSFIDRSFYDDQVLQYLLRKFPDTFLLMYRPVYQLKKAPIELDIILMTPSETLCIVIVHGENGSLFQGNRERFWKEFHNDKEKKQLSPLLALNRLYNVVSGIYQYYDIMLPIKKIVLSQSSYIDSKMLPYDINCVDKRTEVEWRERLIKLPSPLKSEQLKGAQALMNHCFTTAVTRPEWSIGDGEYEYVGDDEYDDGELK